MKFILTLNCDSDAFAEDCDEETARILEVAAAELREGISKNPMSLLDTDDRVVGSMEFINDLSIASRVESDQD